MVDGYCYLKTGSDQLTGNAPASVAGLHSHHHHVVNLLEAGLSLKQLLGRASTVQGDVQEVDIEREGGQVWLSLVVSVQVSDDDEKSLLYLLLYL